MIIWSHVIINTDCCFCKRFHRCICRTTAGVKGSVLEVFSTFRYHSSVTDFLLDDLPPLTCSPLRSQCSVWPHAVILSLAVWPTYTCSSRSDEALAYFHLITLNVDPTQHPAACLTAGCGGFFWLYTHIILFLSVCAVHLSASDCSQVALILKADDGDDVWLGPKFPGEPDCAPLLFVSLPPSLQINSSRDGADPLVCPCVCV